MKSIKGLLKSVLGKKLILIFIAVAGLVLTIIPSIPKECKNYTDNTEEKLKSILESVTGEGTIEVMITYENTYGASENQSGLFYEAQAQSNTPKTEISGVMIVCRGFTDTNDFDIIKRAASTALGTDQNKIYIIGGANQQ